MSGQIPARALLMGEEQAMRDPTEDQPVSSKGQDITKAPPPEHTCPCGIAPMACISPACQAPVQGHHVHQAVAEYELVGREEFMALYGFGQPDTDVLIVDGKSYEPKPILGAAYKLATGHMLGPSDFGEGRPGAADALRAKGFELRSM